MTFFNLPNELILMILENLDDLNQILACRLVNRKFNELVNSIRLKNLEIASKNTNSQTKNSIEFELPIESHPSFLLWTNSLAMGYFKSKLLKILATNLKQLYLSDKLTINTKLKWLTFTNFLQNLTQLEHLTIKCLQITRERVLYHQNIKMLDIDTFNNTDQITLELPSLKVLWLQCSVRHVNILHSETIEHLILGKYCDYMLYHREFLSLFSNLAQLSYVHYNHDNFWFENTLPKLQVVHFRTIKRRHLTDLIKQRKVNRVLNLKFFVYGILIDDLRDVDQLYGDINPDSALEFNTKNILDNYDNLKGSIEVCSEFDFGKTIQYFKQRTGLTELPKNFIQKFAVIKKIVVNQFAMVNRQQFIQFLKNCSSITEMLVLYAAVDQDFYDNLYTYCNGLTTLNVIEQSLLINNFSFLMAIRSLRNFSINQFISIDQIDLLHHCQSSKHSSLKIQYLLPDNRPVLLKLESYGCAKVIIELRNHQFTYSGLDLLDGLHEFQNNVGQLAPSSSNSL